MPKTSIATTSITDITTSLDHVKGGAGTGAAIVKGAKAAWGAAKPWLGRADKAIETASKYGGSALAAKEGYDLLTGGGGGGGNTGGGTPGGGSPGGNMGGGNTGGEE